VFQFGFEPWRRRRLVHGFEEKVREALDKEREAVKERRGEVKTEGEPVELDNVVLAGIQELQNESENGAHTPQPAVDALVACIAGETAEQAQQPEEEAASLDAAEMHVPTEHPAPVHKPDYWNPEAWKAAAKELFSDKTMVTSKKDVTIIALEGAATGAAMVAIIATLFLRSS